MVGGEVRDADLGGPLQQVELVEVEEAGGADPQDGSSAVRVSGLPCTMTRPGAVHLGRLCGLLVQQQPHTGAVREL